ncbi:MAG: hypothetical protein DPW09_43715 [Anaerolineae bacterium]|nr:hypothetical protein [Anaerolineae bacterium]
MRQPDWWRGDSSYHPPAYTEPVSNLEARLCSGAFVITAEIAPPLDTSSDSIHQKAGWLKEYVAAANFTDNASASPRMSSLAASKICLDLGLEPVMQLQARDRSRVVLESDAIGAAGLGIRNILCLSGDHQRFGPGPMTKPDQFDMDAVQVLWMLRRMRDEGIFDGDRLVFLPEGSRNPDRLAEPRKIEPSRLNSHTDNWLQCLRSRQTPRADIQAGFSHAVAGTMAAAALETGRRITFDPGKLEFS